MWTLGKMSCQQLTVLLIWLLFYVDYVQRSGMPSRLTIHVRVEIFHQGQE